MRRRASIVAFAATVVIATDALAQGPSVGPYRFLDARCFASTATLAALPGFDNAGRFAPPLETTTLEEAVLGYSPSSSLLNLGNPCGPVPCGATCPPPESFEYLDLGFDADRRPREGPGYDLVVFDARFSADDYQIAVRPVGGAFTPPRSYPAAGQVDTGVTEPFNLWAIEIDLADFGLRLGVEVETVRIVASCALDPFVEYDPAMAASVVRSCTSAASCDDGDPCSEKACVDGRCRYALASPGSPCPDGVCNAEGACVECIADEECDEPTAHCDVSTESCVACLVDDHCPSSTNECLTAICTDGACDDTTPKAAGTPCALGVCDGEADARCVECLSDLDCPSERPLCDALNTACIECRTASDCPAAPCSEVACDLFGACVGAPIPDCGEDGGVADGGPSNDRDASTTGDAGLEPPGDLSEGCRCSTHDKHPSDTPLSGSIAWVAAALMIRARRSSRR